MLEIIMLVGLVLIAKEWFGDGGLKVALVIVGLLVLFIIVSAFGDTMKAHGNFVRYWAKGGPDRRRRRW